MTSANRVAARFLQAMARKREIYKDKIQSRLIGGIVEYYKATLAKKNGLLDYVEHWNKEVRRLINEEMVYEILYPIRGFKDRHKAFDEAVVEIKRGDSGYKRYADTVIKKDFNLTKLKYKLNDQDTDAFWKHVKEVAATALHSMK